MPLKFSMPWNSKIAPYLSLAPTICMVCLSGFVCADQGDWDISDTGEPFKTVEFEVSEGTWMSLDVSPDGRSMVFDLLGDIYTIPVSGGDATLVRGGPAIQRQPRFSADGAKVLYVSDASGADNLWVADADGGEARQVTHETTARVTSPTWGPSDDYVVATKFYMDVHRPGTELWLWHVDGGQGRMVVDGENVSDAHVSLDGKYIYFMASGPVQQSGDRNQPITAIKRKHLGSGEIKDIVAGFGGPVSPRLSPDGSQLAFVRQVKAKAVLFVLDLKTGKQVPLYDELDRVQPANLYWHGYTPQYGWFPDSRHIAIWSGGQIHKISVADASAERVSFRARSRHRLTETLRFENELAPESFRVRSIRHVARSPDDREIVFSALGKLWRKRLPDGAANRLTEGDELEFEPSFNFDGLRIAYVAWHDERGGALKLASGGEPARTLVKSRAPIRTPAFSGDGQTLAYAIEPGNDRHGGYGVHAGIYTIPVSGGEPRMVSEEGINPQFSPDGHRIFFTIPQDSGISLKSMRLDGFDVREHAKSSTASLLKLSPDLKWLVFEEYEKLYVVPYLNTAETVEISSTHDFAPIQPLSTDMGWEPHFSPNSSQVHWLLGSRYFSRGLAAGSKNSEGIDIGLVANTDKPDSLVAITGAQIITMEGNRVIANGTVLVEGNRIRAVGPDNRVIVPEGAFVLDATGKTVMPGIIDAHGHIDLFQAGFSPMKMPGYYASLAFGITTNFDPSAREQPTFTNAEMVAAGQMIGPRLLGTGPIIYGFSGSSDFNPINSLEDARAVLKRRQQLGIFAVKSYLQPMRQQRQQLIKAAREKHMMVMPEGEQHFYNNISMVLDGHTTIEHKFAVGMIYDDIVQLLSRSGTAVTPTMIVTSGGENYFYATERVWEHDKVNRYVPNTLSVYSPMGGSRAAPPHVRGMRSITLAQELYDIGFRNDARANKKLHDGGVMINVGGHGQIHGLAAHWEMWLLSEGGMGNHDVLRAATINGARTLGLDRQIGSLAPGKLADLIVLDKDPLQNIRHTDSVSYTMINGRLYECASMDEVGYYDRPRTMFYWELDSYNGIDWNESWGGDRGPF